MILNGTQDMVQTRISDGDNSKSESTRVTIIACNTCSAHEMPVSEFHDVILNGK